MEVVRPSDGPLEYLVTPYFSHMNIENVPQSQLRGEYVSDIVEVCQIRFAGDKNFSPVVRAADVYRSDGINAVTYAERFAKQYQQFQASADQTADGTPLEKLKPYGITAAQMSLCRALKIHNIEAIEHLEGSNLRAAGAVIQNVLKPMVRNYLEDRANGGAAIAEIAALRAEIEAMRAGSIVIPVVEVTPTEVDALTEEAEKEALKVEFATLTGQRPRGNPALETMRAMVAEARAA